ncbi:MAG: 1-(5-phosphoribosyl)-5-((5-phosphoribosylamino)methylideneamino)imidazole-4-carboxamide isomerase, partial [Opitutae bacterium]|nr:1-(5-phosphoribosyl)-5-((5-phosphoribosylamino)methylideneamino)imidazole-4-carboxamide isomerase [Opitutae bacterium]
MILYPAIDIRNGRCVRLNQGRDDAQTSYYENPVEPAEQFTQAGAEWIHVVDLDGAFGGAPRNLNILQKISS